jgi:energy-coupling factor transporter ATP-binding protein EcfA2
MYISKFQVSNFKSYRDSTEVEFKPGFNIITGQNNAGKTALLEALTLDLVPKPHRSIRSMPVPGALPQEGSSARVTFVLSGEELLRSLQTMGSNNLFPAPNPADTQASMDRHLEDLIRAPRLRLSMRLERRNDERWIVEDTNFLDFYPVMPNPGSSVPVFFPVSANAGGLVTTGGHQYVNPAQDVRTPLAHFFRSKIYRFRAERFNLGQYSFGDSAILAPDASNLPQVLNTLNSNPARFDRLNAMATEILPQVRQISVRPTGGQVEILIWSHDPLTERGDLAIPLNECGSGIGQVLAILYVVMTSDHPQAIIVDEPQNFLHPGAVRKLIEVLKKYPQHQYVFATHSSAVITASDPATFTMARATDGESVLEVMDPSNAKHLQTYLSEIGARLSDVFGADNILWVEGQTEEECFPLILRNANWSLSGTAVVGIRQTGDLQGRDKKKVLEMYRKLSEARTLLPPAIAFVFDQECLTQQQKDDLHAMGPGVHFLPRRMYENYLLYPAAVAAVMNGIAGFRDQPISEDEVRRFFERRRGERKEPGMQLRYFCRGVADVPADWERNIDAAKLLEDTFQELSETRASYEKTTHSIAITEWLIANEPAAVREIAEFLMRLLAGGPAVR